jgi:hypothetical protein
MAEWKRNRRSLATAAWPMDATIEADEAVVVDRTPPTRAAPSRAALLVCAGVVWTLGILMSNILPIPLEFLRHERGLDVSQLGTIGSVYVLGNGAVTVSAPLWVRRLNPRLVSTLGLILVAGALFSISVFTSLFALTSGWLVIGIATAMVSMPCFSILGDATNPVRVYSVALFGSTLFAMAISFIVAKLGLHDALVAGGALFALGIPVALTLTPLLPDGARLPTAPVAAPSAARRAALAAPLLAMLAGAVFLGVSWGGIWTFAGVIAAAGGIDVRGTGLVVGMGLTGSLVGSALPALIGKRISPLVMISVAMLGVVLTYPAMLSSNTQVFMVGFAVHGALTTTAFAYLLGIVRRVDHTDRVFVAFPAIRELGGAGGTKFTGGFLAHSTPDAFFGLAAIIVVTSWLLLMGALRIAPRGATAAPTEAAAQ